MQEYIKFYDESVRWLRIVLSALGIPAFLYRLFHVILEKANDASKIVYMVFEVLPILGMIVYVVDIVFCALNRNIPLNLADALNGGSQQTVEAEVIDEPKDGEQN